MRVLLFITLCISLLFYAGDTFSESDEICRTWVNTAYDPGNRPQKLIFNYDGTFETYGSQASTDALLRGVFQIAKKWRDETGNIWYQIKMLDMYGTRFKLAKISNGGDKLEFVCKPYKYPAEIKKNEPGYCSYMRAAIQ